MSDDHHIYAPECTSGPPEGRREVDVDCLWDVPCTRVLQVLDVTRGRSGSQININAGGKWAGEGGGCADRGDGEGYKAVISILKCNGLIKVKTTVKLD